MSSSRPSKRQRIYRACDQCRRRKSKCDGEQPSCSICRVADRSCTYENGGGRRGLAPGYVRSLETILGLVIQHVPNSEKTVHDLLAKSRNNDHFFAKDPATVWRKSRLAKAMPLLLDHEPQENLTLSAQDDPEWDTSEIPITPAVISGDTVPAVPDLNELPQPQTTPKVNPTPPEIFDQSFPAETLDMLENYFKYTHCWFPIMEHHDLLRTMHTSSQPQKSPEDGCRLALWAVVAYEISTDNRNDRVHPVQSQVTTAIYSRAMTQSSNLELGHIQALLVVALLQLKLGDIAHAWRLSGLASRMLASLRPSAKRDRFCHTFNGCILLDNMTSALLKRSPCMSLIEQQEGGSIDEDNMEEWSVWIISSHRPRGQHRDPSQGPLRALSIFNKLKNLMEYLTKILHSSFNVAHADVCDIFSSLQVEQKLLIEMHPYDSSAGCVTPPVIILHLTCNFVIIALFVTSPEAVAMIGNDLTGGLLQSTIDLFDLYVNTTGVLRMSPLLNCFALQFKQCLDIDSLIPCQSQRELLQHRVSPYLPHMDTEPTSINQILRIPRAIDPDLSTEVPIVQEWNPSAEGPPNVFVQPSVLQPPDPQLELPTPANSTIPVSGSPDLFVRHSPRENAFGETGAFDALFEEMVTSMPSNRQQPTFAQNLGFYAGDLDKDFLEQLQRSTDD
ncbi:unnamed protein product [Penicillium salamii]|uniref:Zn(2)-C6 fungal-type domain-containing protein n=1 Tax=Penicillium salamii TaxID=1612424 RepID=A0A9W4IGI4_9EURO|nr:unnamed protein product [Penicillium salamii]CAG8036184.1 unnamed protein product [Penicillium salamii]CAG8089172.1 unnamed protein product [Penicillium salamii]CAG8165408.1 unnamed protein product [Penicillium salamii]CAG8205522.1 unnamed protein product [Penicillium salamii]